MLESLSRQRSYSQNGQDRLVIEKLFPGLRGGTFIEIGAFDGETFSNTALLEREYGWSGICIEPLPDAFAKLKANRSCICVNAAAAATADRELSFEAIDGYGAMLSGRTDTRPPAHDRRIVAEQHQHDFARKMIAVATVRASDVLRHNNMTTVDFASIDVEGAELECLKGLLDPDITVRAIAIENNYGDTDVHRFLALRGYVRIATAGEDDVYRLRDECGIRDYAMRWLGAPARWARDRKRRQRAAKR